MTKRASEMTMEQIEDVLRDMNWTEIHKARVFSDYGASIVLYTDGEFSVQEQNTYYRDPDAAGVISYLSCWGQGNVDRTDYFEGFAERDEETGLYDISGDHPAAEPWLVSEDKAFELSIEQGDWDYTEEIDAVLENVKRDREQASYRA